MEHSTVVSTCADEALRRIRSELIKDGHPLGEVVGVLLSRKRLFEEACEGDSLQKPLFLRVFQGTPEDEWTVNYLMTFGTYQDGRFS